MNQIHNPQANDEFDNNDDADSCNEQKDDGCNEQKKDEINDRGEDNREDPKDGGRENVGTLRQHISYKGSNKSHLDFLLIQEVDQIKL